MSVPPTFAGASLPANASTTGFDISQFSTVIPSPRPVGQSFDMAGLRFFSEVPYVPGNESITFGSSSSPAWTLIGRTQTNNGFNAILLAYGTTTLNFGPQQDYQVSWSGGLYTVQAGPNGSVAGGVTIQDGAGLFYTAQLLNSAIVTPIKSITQGVVTTTKPHQYTPGQMVTFSQLTGASGVQEGVPYFVVDTSDSTHFTFSATSGGAPITDATATGGNSAPAEAGPGGTVPDPEDKWGAALTLTQTIPLVQKTSINPTVGAGFTPTRMLLSTTADVVPLPVLLFEGTQAVSYKGSGFTFGLGGQSANQGKNLQINAQGIFSLIDTNSGENTIVVTASFGSGVFQTRTTLAGTMTGNFAFTNGPHGLVTGDYIVFGQLDNPGGGLRIGVPYQVSVKSDQPDEFTIVDGSNTQYSTGPNSSFRKLQSLSISNGLVTVPDGHQLTAGDPVQFFGLSGADNISVSTTYYVSRVISPTTFYISTSVDPADEIKNAAATSGDFFVPLFQAGSFKFGGQMTVTLAFNGSFSGPNPITPTNYTMDITGQLSADYDSQNGVQISGDVTLGDISNHIDGLKIEINNGQFSVPDWSFRLNGNGSFANGALKVSINGLSVDTVTAADNSESTRIDGGVSVTLPAFGNDLTVQGNLGKGTTDGVVIDTDPQGNRKVTQVWVHAEFDKVKPNPSGGTFLFGSTQIYGGSFDFQYPAPGRLDTDPFSFTIGGGIVLAVGDSTPDADGNWKAGTSTVTFDASPGLIDFDDTGFHPHIDPNTGGRLYFDINGNFNIGELTFVAQNLQIVFEQDPGKQGSLMISGGVSLPQLRGASIVLGDVGESSGLIIDTTTGQWHLDGFRIVLPTFSAGPFKLENVTLGFGFTDSKDWQLLISGTLRLFQTDGKPGTGISVKLELGEQAGQFIITAIGADIRNLNPGIPIAATDGFLTDAAFEVDNIPHNISADILFGGTFGQTVTIAGRPYALIHALAEGTYNPSEIKIIGQILLANGLLGSLNGTLDLDWGINTYTVAVDGKYLDDLFEGHFDLSISPLAVSGMASVLMKVPSGIPFIGGKTLAQAEALWDVPSDPSQDRYVAGWVELFDHWAAGVKYDLRTNKVSFIGGKQIAGLEAQVPIDVKQPYTSTVKFTPTSPSTQTASQLLGDDDLSVDAHGIFHVMWQGNDPSAKIYLNTGSSSVQVWGPGVDTTKPQTDSYNGTTVAYRVLPDQTTYGDVAIQVIPIDALGDNPDLYARLPLADFSVTLASTQQVTVDTNSWSGTFTAPPSQVQGLALSSNQGDALGVGANPNLINVNLQYRTTDPGSTSIDLYYDFDKQGYNGKKFMTITPAQLTAASQAAGVGATVGDDNWVNYSTQWDISQLPPYAARIYAVVRDNEHAPQTTAYTATSVESYPSLVAAINIQGGISPNEGQGWLMSTTPVTPLTVTSIVSGVITTSATSGSPSIGDPVTFTNVANLTGLTAGKNYYVVSVNAGNHTFSVAARPGGPVIFDATGGAGTAYATISKGTLAITSIANGVITTSATSSFPKIGDQVTLTSVANLSGLDVGTTYYVVSANAKNFTFSLSTDAGGPVIDDASGGAGTAAAVFDTQTLTQFTDSHALTNWTLAPGGWYALSVSPKSDGYVPIADSEINFVDNVGNLVQYIQIGDEGEEVNTTSPFERMPMITGTVYADIDANGSRESTDIGVAGMTVYIDSNNNGQLDPGELSTITRQDGTYELFPTVPDDGTSHTFTLRQIVAAGWKPNTTVLTASLAANDPPVNGNDFLNVQYVTLGGTVFDDANNNGVKDAGEQGIPGATVTVSGADSGTITTAADGTWVFQSIKRGDYQIKASVNGTQTTPVTVSPVLGDSQPQSIGIAGMSNMGLNVTASDSVPNADSTYTVYLGGGLGSGESGAIKAKLAIVRWIGTTDANSQATLIWSATDEVELFYTSMTRLMAGAVPGTPGLVFAVIDSSNSSSNGAIVSTQLIQVNPDGTSRTINAYANEKFAASPNLAGGGGLVSVDSTGKVYVWSSQSGFTRRYIGSVSGTPVDIATLHVNGSSDSTTPESFAILTTVNGKAQIQIMDPDGSVSAPTAVDVSNTLAFSIVAGDFNYDGIDDLATLTVDQTYGYYSTITILVNDGTGEFWQTTYTTDRESFGNLNTIKVLGGKGDQVGWGGVSLYVANAGPQGPNSFHYSSTATDLPGRVSTLVTIAPNLVFVPSVYGTLTNELAGVIVSASESVDLSFTAPSDLTHAGGQFGGYNFGFHGADVPAATTLGGVVFNDINGNGVHDASEPSLTGYILRLVAPDGSIRTVVSADGSNGSVPGSYSFSNVLAGSYVQVQLPNGSWLSFAGPTNVSTDAPVPPFAVVGAEFVAGPNLPPLGTPPPTLYGASTRAIVADLQGHGSKNFAFVSAATIYINLTDVNGVSYWSALGTGAGGTTYYTNLKAGDINGDGILDLVVGGYSGMAVLFGLGFGEFSAPTVLRSSSSQLQSLLNTDSVISILPGGPNSPDQILVGGRGPGTLYRVSYDRGTATLIVDPQAISTNTSILTFDTGDIDGDGNDDLAILDNSGAVWVFNGPDYSSRTLATTVSGLLPSAELKVLGLDVTGQKNIMVANGGEGKEATFWNIRSNGSSGFTTQSVDLGTSDGGTNQVSIAVGDFDGRGIASDSEVAVAIGRQIWMLAADPSGQTAPTVIKHIAAPDYVAAMAATSLSGGPAHDLVLVQADTSIVSTLVNIAGAYNLGIAGQTVGAFDFPVHLSSSDSGAIYGTVFTDLNGSGSWSPNDPGRSEGVVVYLDLNNNGTFDAGEPSQVPSDLNGTYSFHQLRPGSYVVRLTLNQGLDNGELTQSLPAGNAGITVTVTGLPSFAYYGADFGVVTNSLSSDFNGDGQPDLLLTDPSDNSVHVQLHNGTSRLGTVKLGQLPGSKWSVVGSADMNGDSFPDVLLQDAATGTLRVWQMRGGGGTPQVEKEYDLNYHVPIGSSVVALADENDDHRPDLIIRNDKTSAHSDVTLTRDGKAVETPLKMPAKSTILAVGDVSGDGHSDVLYRKTKSGPLLLRLRDARGKTIREIKLGKVPANWSVSGIMELVDNTGGNEILFQDRTTGKAYAYSYAPEKNLFSSTEVEIGQNNGLRIHLAENRDSSTISGRILRDLRGNGLLRDVRAEPGVSVQLFADVNGSGSLDNADGAAIAEVVSGSDGTFDFTRLPAGNYFVQEVVPDGSVRTGGPQSQAYYAVTVNGDSGITGYNFYNFRKQPAQITNIQYQVTRAGQTRTVTTLQGNVVAGDRVKVLFTVPKGHSQLLSFVSYALSDSGDSPSQQLFATKSGLFGPGEHSLTAVVPPGQFELDFVSGYAIPKFGPSGSNLTYADQGRLIAKATG